MRLFLALGFLAILSGCARGPGARPNIILILIDTLRADYLGSYGFQGPVSNNLDSLAKESFVFEKAYSAAPWTKPSVASLMTSLYARTHRVVDQDDQFWKGVSKDLKTDTLSPQALTLAEALSARGYDCAGFVTSSWVGASFGFSQGFRIYEDPFSGGEGQKGLALQSRGDKALKDAGDFLGQDPSSNGNSPRFAYIHLVDVHGPYQASRADFDELKNSPSLGEPRALSRGETASRPDYLDKLIDWNQFDPGLKGRREAWRAFYAAGVRNMDRRLGVFLARARAQGWLDNSILVVTSDHGEELADHGGWNHGHTMTMDQIHVPLLIRPPGGLAAPRRLRDVVSLIDVMPTLLALAGKGTEVPGMQGRDLSPLLKGEALEAHGAYSSGVYRSPALVSWVDGSRQLLFDLVTEQASLYDLEQDPGELHDLAAVEPKLTRQMARALNSHVAWLKTIPPLLSGKTPLNPKVVEELKSLGYLI